MPQDTSQKPAINNLPVLRKQVLDEIEPKNASSPAVSSAGKDSIAVKSRPAALRTVPAHPAALVQLAQEKDAVADAPAALSIHRPKAVKTDGVHLTRKSLPRVKKQEKSSVGKRSMFAAFAFALILLAGLLAMLYIFRVQNRISDFFIEHLPLPAVVVGGSLATFKEYRAGVSALETYYRAQPDTQDIPDQSDIEARVADRMVDNLLARRAAAARGISISPVEVESTFATLTEGLSGEEMVADALQKLYGWTPEEFKSYVVRPFLIQQMLHENIAADATLNAPIHSRMEVARERIVHGEPFTDVAKEVSEGPNAASGGDLGWIGHGVLLTDLDAAAFALAQGEMSDIVRSPYGFHLIFVEEENVAQSLVHARDIFFNAYTLEAFLAQQKKDTAIVQFVP
ncbi:MAG: hypothetical protein COT39_01745 [Parcubacteria group bacterium CG08_land_8_20_14_0_20_48_21]|nr:MAG: hypothetical protein AUK21_02665 [Parcubacteria group bacterium CG2_30_48_51]PIS32962.1 MAG: hypothetical protein COT39_01745 [Parcubacteria group bacterium CG08_land_8_20_14_0_20_48_21]PIW78885.1 MAG: hypothetical protein COZ99_04005 [Parcubacteria group bacterium CG_4_8_14_3_um_filter_48_16]PIY77929.1 MAG: hypothetical protein COY83_02665 [Parcubacteria group bacterium CG_4_10_14_0_8_um_filter_48_154]PIZ78613.1 MAG: hypothetical protein COY03_00070 [bacterium CG_4_10_14_0_2_um_filter_